MPNKLSAPRIIVPCLQTDRDFCGTTLTWTDFAERRAERVLRRGEGAH